MNFIAIKERLDLYERLMRLDKPIGILLLLWPTLWALWIAGYGQPAWMLVAVFVLGTVLMRSAGCVINDYADQEFDPLVERTKDRPLATGQISKNEALLLAAALVLCAFALVLFLPRLVIMLSIPALLLAVSYPYSKRFFVIPQAWLGIAFGFGIPMAFAAQWEQVPQLAWLLLLGNMFWTIAYDTEYAMVDRDDDLRIGIKTSAITFGRYDIAAVMVCYAMALAIFTYIGLRLNFGTPYFTGLAVAAGIAGYHFTLIRERDRQQCFKAFLHNNWFGAAVFAGLVLELSLVPLLRQQ